MKFFDHIGVFPNALSDELCEKLITLFEKAHSSGFTVSRQNHDKSKKMEKDDDALFILESDLSSYRISTEVLACIWKNAYHFYAEKYDVLKTLEMHTIYDLKIQKTGVGGGYHIWHCEHGGRSVSNRMMAFTIYLNTVDEGGETEFLYQSKRIKSEKGTIVLFPASYTHTHRGNPPLSNPKYIVTGWIEF